MQIKDILMHDDSSNSRSIDAANEEEEKVLQEEDTTPFHEKQGQELNKKRPSTLSDDGRLKTAGKPRWYTDKNGVFRKRRKPNWKVSSRKAMKQFLKRGSFVVPSPKTSTVLQK